MKAWAIRDKTTSLYLRYSTKQFSTSEIDATLNDARLFPSRRNATSALYAWLQGIWRQSGYIDSYSGEAEYELAPRRVEGRVKENMEIVEFDLVEVK